MASNALVGSTFEPLLSGRIRTGSHTLIVEDIRRPEGLAADQIRTFYKVMDDGTGRALPTTYAGGPSFFDLALDEPDHSFLIPVFDDSVSGGILYETNVTLGADASRFQRGRPEDLVPIHILALDRDGNPISIGEVRDIVEGDVKPEFLRASDIEIAWENTGEVVRPQRVYDLDNQVEVAFAKPETTVVGADTTITPGEAGSNWGFVQRQFLLRTEDSLPLPLRSGIVLYVSGARLIIPDPVTPQTGDRWIVRQSAVGRRLLAETITRRDSVHVVLEDSSVVVDSVFVDRLVTYRPLPARRPPVPGTRYRIDLQGGGPLAGPADLGEIRVVPNPYLGMARFETAPDDRQLHFVNLPARCTIRLYTISGNLVRVLEHTAEEGGTEVWDLKTREGLPLASGNYYYHVTTPEGRTHLGRFAVIR